MKPKRSIKLAEAAIHGVGLARAAGRKDRHSKVSTARGTRDRRVRLSPKTAILFYDVQDRLGYDRPSKAIDWLMKEAKSAIDALDHPPPPPAMIKLNDEIDPAAGFGCFNEGAPPPPPMSRSEVYEAQFLHAPPPLDTNSEIFRLQRIFYANAGGVEDYSAAEIFSEREPLQSSYDNSPQFQGFSCSNVEMPDFGGAPAFQKDGIPVLNKSSSFIHY